MSNTPPPETTKEVSRRFAYDSPFASPIITLYVGADRVPFDVHRDIICQKSTFFEANFGRAKQGGNGGIAMLKEDDPAEILRLVEFLYTQKYVVSTDPSCELWVQIQMHTRIYCVGDKYGIPDMQDYAAGLAYELLSRIDMSSKSVVVVVSEILLLLMRYVYRNTASQQDVLRKLLVSYFAVGWTEFRNANMVEGEIDAGSKLAGFMQEFPRFMEDLLLCLGSGSKYGRPRRVPRDVAAVAGTKRKELK